MTAFTSKTLPDLHTPRLRLRALTVDDVDAVFGICSNPNMTRYTLFETHGTLSASQAFIVDYALPNYAQGVPDPFAITLKSTGELIGCTGGHWTESRCNRCVEFGYWIGEPHWNQGYATEAVKALVPYLFEALRPARIQAHCMGPNDASARVLEKAGLQYEGTLRKAVCRRGAFMDMRIYAIVSEEES
jgi:ribosomal-protein-alanine N-acetyltransferase